MTFRKAAPRWCWLAAQTLAWRPDEFWRATPSELLCSLRDPAGPDGQLAPARELIEKLMERDAHGR
ncbi:MAG: phage tail assembly chaperone [Pseudomonadota bacterium]